MQKVHKRDTVPPVGRWGEREQGIIEVATQLYLQGGYENYLPQVDALVSTLFEDLDARGLLGRTLVVLCGEFSRTPRMNDGGNGGPPRSMGTPGRDHWGEAMFCLLGGGGVRGGQVIGATDPVGYAAIERPIHPTDLHATILHALGINQHELYYLHHNRRELVTVNGGQIVQEVFA